MTAPRPFPLRPNWREPFSVSYEFSTEVLSTDAGKEQRRAWRETPRKTISFLATAVSHARFRSLKGFMAKMQGKTILVPEVTRAVKSSAPSGAFEYDFEIDQTPPPWLLAGATAVLIYDERVESRTVESVSGTTVTFEEMNSAAWFAGVRIAPGLPANQFSEVTATRPIRALAEASFEFQVQPGSEVEAFDEAAELTWNGREVFIRRCNWASPQNLGFLHPTDVVDYGVGRTAAFQPVEFGTELRSADYLATTKAEVTSIVSFFRRCRGRLAEFYVPTDEPDIVIAATVAEDDTQITVPGTALADDYATSTVFKAVSVLMADGRRFYRKVSAVAAVSGSSQITLSTGVPYELTVATVEVISWLPLSRFASDTLEVVWQTDGVATIRANYMTLEDEVPE